MIGKLLTSPKLTIIKNEITCSSDNFVKMLSKMNLTQQKIYIKSDQNSDNLFIHMNISISYHIDDLTALILQNKAQSNWFIRN